MIPAEYGNEFLQWKSPSGGDTCLGIVEFSVAPHLAPDGMPGNSMAAAEKWATGITGPAYLDDRETAIMVVDGNVDVVSEGQWKQLK